MNRNGLWRFSFAYIESHSSLYPFFIHARDTEFERVPVYTIRIWFAERTLRSNLAFDNRSSIAIAEDANELSLAEIDKTA